MGRQEPKSVSRFCVWQVAANSRDWDRGGGRQSAALGHAGLLLPPELSDKGKGKSMKISKVLTRTWLMRTFAFCTVAMALFWWAQALRAEARTASFAAVSLTGVHHMGDKFNIAVFYVDGYDGGNVGRGGGGGSRVCCVLLPKKWRPGLFAEVRWNVNDWSHENRAEIEAGNYKSADGIGYIARVPVERYEVAERMWVHFYAGGKVRVVSSSPGSGGPTHPIQDDDPHAIDSATQGRQVQTLFSIAELEAMDRKDVERKKKFGDWR